MASVLVPSEVGAEAASRLVGGRQVRANDAKRMASWSRLQGASLTDRTLLGAGPS